MLGVVFFPLFLTLFFNFKTPTDLASPIPAGFNSSGDATGVF